MPPAGGLRQTHPAGRFPACSSCDIFCVMKVRNWLRRLLPILAIVGLLAAPFTAPVSGPAMAAATMAAMPDDIPCCPEENRALPDCQKTCPLMAICMAKCFSAGPMLSNVALTLRGGADVMRPRSDVAGDALMIEPPARPPRI